MTVQLDAYLSLIHSYQLNQGFSLSLPYFERSSDQTTSRQVHSDHKLFRISFSPLPSFPSPMSSEDLSSDPSSATGGAKKRSRFADASSAGDVPPPPAGAAGSSPDSAVPGSVAPSTAPGTDQPATASAAASTGPTERILAVKKKVYPPTVQYPQADFISMVKRERSRIQGSILSCPSLLNLELLSLVPTHIFPFPSRLVQTKYIERGTLTPPPPFSNKNSGIEHGH